MSFRSEKEGRVSLSVYDMNGNLVSIAYNGMVSEGTLRQIEIKTDNLPAGAYLFQLKTPTGIIQKKLVLAR